MLESHQSTTFGGKVFHYKSFHPNNQLFNLFNQLFLLLLACSLFFKSDSIELRTPLWIFPLFLKNNERPSFISSLRGFLKEVEFLETLNSALRTFEVTAFALAFSKIPSVFL
ncbi:hypothetical protein P301_M12201 [Saccharomyces cerevisiae P301]|uniref:Putative uncharacterized protein YMR153C-A n=2 Tax=Saccharomyces cerevisiae TaxID=4932 RepID=YM153_YEAST|nr:RecName: Full=Putative uncharacterized protein YMR153C-A [Saccharomyces cerevisiae S288C]AHX39333.1 hypothetical protein YMR153C-A [Saccharomyces cerevisiae]EWG84071.1 hypothetical protein R008_M12206 [Saccharomyces cerevisiae R008]EWG89429.1 hypothetical protein P301_M12201 [Saccharomyces cerevisiae P301]EWG94095.1 hypothetical protein R103_M21176 [Saccharomyces cerevisiae R103]CAY81977.1 EC1118_1M3_3356p [Saccharomyces cerevisiae EC1118]